MPLRLALAQPLPVVLLLCGVGAAIAVWALPDLDRWAGRAPWILVWGLAAYAAAVVILAGVPAVVRSQEYRRVEEVRRGIARNLERVRHDRPALAPVLAEAVDHLDHQILPVLRQLALRQQGLNEYLARYDVALLPRPPGRAWKPPATAPDPAVLGRVRDTFQRQREAIEECVQQAVNAEATLVAMLAAGDDTEIGVRARTWSAELLSLHDYLTQALNGAPAPASGAPAAPSAAAAPAAAAPVLLVAEAAATSEAELARLTEAALKDINNHFSLARCGLADHLPATLAAARAAWGAGRAGTVTPLEQAQALHEVLVQTIERLKPPDDSLASNERSLRYHVVRERYLEGKDTRRTMTHHNISESTLHRYRRQGIEAIAHDLQQGELALCQRAAAEPPPGVAASI